MKLVTTEQYKIVKISKDKETLQNLNNTIDLKDYFAKIKYKVDNSLPLSNIPNYYILKKQFTLSNYQSTFSNKSIKFSIRSYINLLLVDFTTKPLYISKNITLKKNKELDEGNKNVSKNSIKNNIINLKEYIKDLL